MGQPKNASTPSDQALADFEHREQLPALTPGNNTAARRIRYELLVDEQNEVIISAARQIHDPRVWVALKGGK